MLSYIDFEVQMRSDYPWSTGFSAAVCDDMEGTLNGDNNTLAQMGYSDAAHADFLELSEAQANFVGNSKVDRLSCAQLYYQGYIAAKAVLTANLEVSV